MDAKAQHFGSFDELNVWLEARCRALWSEVPHPDYAGTIVADALEQEQMYLIKTNLSLVDLSTVVGYAHD